MTRPVMRADRTAHTALIEWRREPRCGAQVRGDFVDQVLGDIVALSVLPVNQVPGDESMATHQTLTGADRQAAGRGAATEGPRRLMKGAGHLTTAPDRLPPSAVSGGHAPSLRITLSVTGRAGPRTPGAQVRGGGCRLTTATPPWNGLEFVVVNEEHEL
ncbi:hypothetical protein ACOMHN_009014 [Nucella lapillus]